MRNTGRGQQEGKNQPMPAKRLRRIHFSRFLQTSRGFTFVELLLVIFVFITASAGVIGSYLATHYLSHYAKETMMATNDLRDMMESINATPFSALSANFPSGTANGPANSYSGIVGGYLLTGESVTVTYPSMTATRREVLVVVTWTSRGSQRTASLAGLKTSS